MKSINRLKMQSKLSWAKRAHGAGKVTIGQILATSTTNSKSGRKTMKQSSYADA